MTWLAIAVGIVLICFGALLGSSLTTQALGGVSRRHAVERRNLNDDWRALERAFADAKATSYCPRCRQRDDADDADWLVVVHPTDEEDDGT